MSESNGTTKLAGSRDGTSPPKLDLPPLHVAIIVGLLGLAGGGAGGTFLGSSATTDAIRESRRAAAEDMRETRRALEHRLELITVRFEDVSRRLTAVEDAQRASERQLSEIDRRLTAARRGRDEGEGD